MESLKGDPVMEKKELLYEGKAKKSLCNGRFAVRYR